MSLIKLTMTGIDAQTDLGALALICMADSEERIEFGILRSPDRQGRHPRHPDPEIVDKITGALPWQHLAFHLCEGFAEQAADGNWDELAKHVDFAAVGRIQVNLDIYSNEQIETLQALAAHIGRPVIVQWREPFRPLGGLQQLQDFSAGRGQTPQRWFEVGDDMRGTGAPVGYAGGLGPDNIAEKLAEITAAAGGHPAWIDCASGVRDAQNRFDLSKVCAMIQAVFPDLPIANPA
jgi:hypothetical protein